MVGKKLAAWHGPPKLGPGSCTRAYILKCHLIYKQMQQSQLDMTSPTRIRVGMSCNTAIIMYCSTLHSIQITHIIALLTLQCIFYIIKIRYDFHEQMHQKTQMEPYQRILTHIIQKHNSIVQCSEYKNLGCYQLNKFNSLLFNKLMTTFHINSDWWIFIKICLHCYMLVNIKQCVIDISIGVLSFVQNKHVRAIYKNSVIHSQSRKTFSVTYHQSKRSVRVMGH